MTDKHDLTIRLQALSVAYKLGFTANVRPDVAAATIDEALDALRNLTTELAAEKEMRSEMTKAAIRGLDLGSFT